MHAINARRFSAPAKPRFYSINKHARKTEADKSETAK
jgi:hypothetical protein